MGEYGIDDDLRWQSTNRAIRNVLEESDLGLLTSFIPALKLIVGTPKEDSGNVTNGRLSVGYGKDIKIVDKRIVV